MKKKTKRVACALAVLGILTLGIGGCKQGLGINALYPGKWVIGVDENGKRVKLCVPYGKDCFVIEFAS